MFGMHGTEDHNIPANVSDMIVLEPGWGVGGRVVETLGQGHEFHYLTGESRT